MGAEESDGVCAQYADCALRSIVALHPLLLLLLLLTAGVVAILRVAPAALGRAPGVNVCCAVCLMAVTAAVCRWPCVHSV